MYVDPHDSSGGWTGRQLPCSSGTLALDVHGLPTPHVVSMNSIVSYELVCVERCGYQTAGGSPIAGVVNYTRPSECARCGGDLERPS